MSDLRCPMCQSAFREVLREGILIDVCTQCRGVWLDRGELEKLLAFASGSEDVAPAPQEQRAYRAEPAPQIPRAPQPQYRRDDDDDDDDRKRRYANEGHYGQGHYSKDYEYDKYGNKRKKKSKLEGILDIFDF